MGKYIIGTHQFFPSHQILLTLTISNDIIAAAQELIVEIENPPVIVASQIRQPIYFL